MNLNDVSVRRKSFRKTWGASVEVEFAGEYMLMTVL